jgi:hypothetical protein
VTSDDPDPIRSTIHARNAGTGPISRLVAALARSLFGGAPASLRVSNTVVAPPAEAFAAMCRVLPHEPYRLLLHDHAGGHPVTDGGVLIFRMPPLEDVALRAFMFHVRLKAVFIDRLYLRLRASPAPAAASELEVAADLGREMRIAARWFLPIYVASGAGIGAGLAALGTAALGGGPSRALLGAAIGATAGAGALAWAGRRAVLRARQQLEGLLAAVARAITTAPSGGPAG